MSDETGADVRAHVEALRRELRRRDLAGFVVPRADEHQGEYVPAGAQRRAWISGFTGSAGIAVVLLDKAALFVDGRYTLQAPAEAPGDIFEFLHLMDDPHTDWAARNLPRGGRLGYDPRLHTVGWVEKMAAAAERAGASLVACDDNPLDAAWPDRPSPPLEPVVPHELRYAGKSSADKRAELAKELEKAGVSAAVLTQPDSIAWLLNVRGADVPCTPLPLSFAILKADASVDWFIDARKLTPDARAQLGNEVAVHEPEAFGPSLESLTGVVRVDPATASAWVFDRLSAAGVKVDRGPDPCALPKACKNEGELAGTRAAHKRDAVAVTRFLCWLGHQAPAGKLTEIDAADRLFAMREKDELFRGPSFETISGAGPNGAIVHYRVSEKTNRKIEPGSLYLVDSGAQYLDGTTDITRTVAIGEPTDEMRRHFTLVLKGHIALATARFPKGTSGSQLDTLARQFLWQAGRDFDHGTGHGVGSYLSVHEGPQRISKVPNSVGLLPGMIVSNEPGYYKQGAYGIRIENLLVVQPDTAVPDAERPMFSFETLTLAPIDRTLIDRKLMSDTEIAWLDAYHARVYETLAPQLDLITTAWLAEATAPIGPASIEEIA